MPYWLDPRATSGCAVARIPARPSCWSALDTIIDINPVDGEAGIVDPEIVRLALADAAAVDSNGGLGRVPSDRCKAGEAIGRRYVAAMKAFIDGGVEKGWKPTQRLDRDGFN